MSSTRGKFKKFGIVREVVQYTRDAEGIVEGEYKSKKVTREKISRYKNTMHLLVTLSDCERHLLDWLTEKMTEDNVIIMDTITRENFIEFMSFITDQRETPYYKDQTVRNAFYTLIKKNLIIPIPNKKKRFYVNPTYYFEGAESKREVLIEKLSRMTNKENIQDE